MKRKQKCTMCGKNFELHDISADLRFEKQIGYGSVHDGERLKLNLCCECFDRLANVLNVICKDNLFVV